MDLMFSKNKQTKTNRLRKRKCKTCKEWFYPENEVQPTCMSAECILPFSKEKKAREIKAQKRLSKQQERKALKDNAEKACNRYIRTRDRKLPCISCGYVWVSSDLNVKIGRERHAGHFESVGKRGDLRFNEDNIHVQCDKCNTWGGGGLIPLYRVNLIKKIGLKRVKMLESNNVPRKYSDDDLIEIARYYNKKTKELENVKVE